MNYMELMNHFWLINEEIDFSCTEKALYFALLDLANKFYWEKEELSFSLQYLCLKIKCSKKALLTARKKLEEHGLIEVRRGYKNVRAATIRIVDIQRKKNNAIQNKKETLKESIQDVLPAAAAKTGNSLETEPVPERVTEPAIKASSYKRKDKEKDKKKTRHSSSSTHFVDRKNMNSHEKETFSEEEEERFIEIVNRYNAICRSLHRPYKLTTARKRSIKEMCVHLKTIDDWKGYFLRLESTPFLGGGSNGWKADFDWILKEENFIKVFENRYYEKSQAKTNDDLPDDLQGFNDNDLMWQLSRQEG